MRFGALVLLFIGMAFPSFAQSEATCTPAKPQTAGQFLETIAVDGMEREYTLYIPSGYDGTQALPLVLSFHGFSSNMADQEAYAEFGVLGERENFIAVYPQGAGFPPRWNNGISQFQPNDDLSDMNFVNALLDELESTLCVDSTRIYATGFSAGGGMVHRLACELSTRITAIGTVAGAYSEIPNGCNPQRAVPVISVHGDADPIVPYEGQPPFLPNIETWAQDWANRNQCEGVMVTVSPTEKITEYDTCTDNADVALYTLIAGGHTWAGTSAPNNAEWLVGKLITDFETSEIMWAFFADKRLNP